MLRAVAYELSSDTAASLLRLAASRLPPIPGGAGLNSLADGTAVLPARCVLSEWLIECPLGEHAGAADVSVALPRETGVRRLIAASTDEPGDPRGLSELRSVLRAAEPRGPLARSVNGLWIEMDAAAPGAPSVFLSPAEARAQPLVAALERLLPAGAGCFLHPAGAGLVDTLLPGGAFVDQVGLMIPRAPAALRLCVGGLDAAGAGSLLRRLRCPDAAHLSCEWRRLEQRSDVRHLAIDVRHALEPRLGIEVRLRQRDPRREPRWADLLGQLVGDRLCTEAQRDALLACCGTLSVADHESCWPAPLARYWRDHAYECLSVFRVRLNHVKLVLDGPAPPLAKAYLSLQHGWVS
jgi:hypothetical protein